MKYLITSIVLIVFGVTALAQTDEDPVLWTQELTKTDSAEYVLVMKAAIMDGWHVYSQFTSDGGSLPSEFTYVNEGTDYELIGSTSESETLRVYSDIFEVEETYFKGQAIFKQKIRILKPDVRQIKVSLFYQVCKEVCIGQDKDFYFTLDGSEAVVAVETIDDRSKEKAAALML
ncbi:protein-disulfide reductase DsbD domain-containing protein, partial [Muriicola sp.]|uniref:protein-disulfide reductase DsbD domain-containing protein n=1 Tax=Muriicola sp. TaxID=2020856 RepID=UPI003C72D217